VEVTSSGKLFQTLAPAIGKARLPTVDRRKDGTSSWLDDADRSLRRLGMSATRVNWDVMQGGAVPCTARHVSVATLKMIRSGTRSQWRLISASVTCSDRLMLKTRWRYVLCYAIAMGQILQTKSHVDSCLVLADLFALRLGAASTTKHSGFCCCFKKRTSLHAALTNKSYLCFF